MSPLYFFLMVMLNGYGKPYSQAVVGPFESRGQCERVGAAVKDRGGYVILVPCWRVKQRQIAARFVLEPPPPLLDHDAFDLPPDKRAPMPVPSYGHEDGSIPPLE